MVKSGMGRATIVALSSGAPPAAIGVIRISGALAGQAIVDLAGALPEPRRASLRQLHDADGKILDHALMLWFPGPDSATGEDLAEFHCHGGRAVVDAVQREIVRKPGFREAEAGEFTRRAFSNGRMDLTEAEGLADLLSAETELQRATAMANAGGAISGKVEQWRDKALSLSAQVEAALDFSDEDDVDELPESFTWNIGSLQKELREWLDRPRSDKLGEGYRVVLAGPPNAGKSSLFNALVESEAAITSPVAGTTRDVIERNVAIAGVPLTFVDTAGLHQGSEDTVEAIGIERAQGELARADLVLWLGAEGEGPDEAWEIAAKSDAEDRQVKSSPKIAVSVISGDGLAELKQHIVTTARGVLPKPGEGALNQRQHRLLSEALLALDSAATQKDLLLIGEDLRSVRSAFDRLIGNSATEDMLDSLFGHFCIGK